MITTAFAMNGAKVYITGRRSEVLEKTSKEINEMVGGKGSVVPYVITDRTTSVLLLISNPRACISNSIQGDVSSKATVKEFYNKVAEKENRVSPTSVP